MKKIVKAVVLNANRKLQVSNISLKKLKKDECRISVKAVGICSSDIPRAFSNKSYRYPLIMGHEISGEIIDLGSIRSKTFKVGQKVSVFPLVPCNRCYYCKKKSYIFCKSYNYYGSRRDGGFSEILNIKKWNLFPIPKNIKHQDAALLEPVAVVVNALNKFELLHKNKFLGKKKIMIIGAGFLGLLAVKIIKMRNKKIDITLIDKNKHKLDQVSGVNKIFIKNKSHINRLLKRNQSKFDFVLQATSVSETINNAIQFASPGGGIILMGNVENNLLIDRKYIDMILRKELILKGTWNSKFNSDKENDWAIAKKLVASGLNPSSYVSHFIKFNEVPEIFNQIFLHKSGKIRNKIIKVLVKP